MRIIAGSAKGRPILAPKGDLTRPTLDRVKESLFNILQFSVAGARVLDLYAGSGNLGLEALSRGAAHAVFNDADRQCAQLIRQNIERLGFSQSATVLQSDALQAISRLTGTLPFDIVFLDPPYLAGAQAALTALFTNGLISPNGIVTVEHDWNNPPTETAGLFRQIDRRKYGSTGISFFQHNQGKDSRP